MTDRPIRSIPADYQFPAWLGERLFTNDFPWEESTLTTFPELLHRVTFHDGYWHGYFPALDCGSVVLVVQPDAIWNPEFCHRQQDWPYLIIELPRAMSVLQHAAPSDYTTNTITDVVSAPVDAARFQEWVEFAKVYDLLPVNFFDFQPLAAPFHRTEVNLFLTGALSILHEASIRLLLYSSTGEALAVKLNG